VFWIFSVIAPFMEFNGFMPIYRKLLWRRMICHFNPAAQQIYMNRRPHLGTAACNRGMERANGMYSLGYWQKEKKKWANAIICSSLFWHSTSAVYHFSLANL